MIRYSNILAHACGTVLANTGKKRGAKLHEMETDKNNRQQRVRLGAVVHKKPAWRVAMQVRLSKKCGMSNQPAADYLEWRNCGLFGRAEGLVVVHV